MVKNKEESEAKKLESLLENSKTVNQFKTIIKDLRKDEIQQVRAKLSNYKKGDENSLTAKLTDEDVERLLTMLDEQDDEKGLYKTNELRPLPFSKTVTIFDVYETDEEHFEPYVSPLATVGAVNTSSNDDANVGEGSETEDMGIDGISGTGQETEENKGMFGLGIFGL